MVSKKIKNKNMKPPPRNEMLSKYPAASLTLPIRRATVEFSTAAIDGGLSAQATKGQETGTFEAAAGCDCRYCEEIREEVKRRESARMKEESDTYGDIGGMDWGNETEGAGCAALLIVGGVLLMLMFVFATYWLYCLLF